MSIIRSTDARDLRLVALALSVGLLGMFAAIVVLAALAIEAAPGHCTVAPLATEPHGCAPAESAVVRTIDGAPYLFCGCPAETVGP